MSRDMSDLASTVKAVMQAGDVEGFLSLCAENVHWGAPDDPSGGCHTRQQVRTWYEAAFGRGVRATVNEVVPGRTAMLVGLTVSRPSSDEDDGRSERWQVLEIRDGRISDICGFDDRTEAATRAGVGNP